ncbi:MAG: prolyl oligopeptidase family serine peptidase [Byssovorax sp.]
MRATRPFAALVLALLAAGCGEPPTVAPGPAPPPPSASVAPPASSSALAKEGPPVAPVREVADTYFGTKVIDPYRWMETDSPELAAWMKAEADYTRGALDALPLRAELGARIKALDNAGSLLASARQRGGKIVYLGTEAGKNTFKLQIRDAKGKSTVLVDPDALATSDKHFSIDYYVPSSDGRLVAYGLSQSGSEMSVIHVIDTTTGKALPDVIDRARYADISWQPDGKAFFYKRDRELPPGTPDTERFIRSRVFLHTLGTPPESDKAVFGFEVSPAISVPDEVFPAVFSPHDGGYVLAIMSFGVQRELTVYAAPRASVVGEKTPWKKIIDRADEIVDLDVHGSDLYLLSLHGAPRGAVVRTPLAKPDLAHATVVVPAGEPVIQGFTMARDALYVEALDGGVARILRAPFGKGAVESIALPIQGSARTLSADPAADGALFALTGWTASPALYSFDPKRKVPVEDTGLIAKSKVDFGAITAEEVKAKSADGTLVPLSIIHRKDLSKDVAHPTLLQGYGAYGVTEEPVFDPMSLAWLERGAVYAVCHARGGGEYGEDWHKGGKLATKPNTIEDFLGCARYLIDQKITSPGSLAGEGTSAGGILIGGAITRRPDLFGAAVIRVGMTNALRFEQIPIGPFNTSEFGTVKTEEGFHILQSIDAYHHVEKGGLYPAVLLTTGITDPRVSPWQAAKMAARLQAATGSGKPVLLRVDYEAGHGIGSSRAQVEAERADKYTFLFDQLDPTKRVAPSR